MTMPKWHQTMRPTLEALAEATDVLNPANLSELLKETKGLE